MLDDSPSFRVVGLAFGLLVVSGPGALPAQTIPDAPSNLVAIALSANLSSLEWTDDDTKQDGFIIEESTSGIETDFYPVAQLSLDDLVFRSSAFPPTVGHYYRVRAYNSFTNSAPSNVTSLPSPRPASVVGWGFDEDGEASPPANLAGVVAIAAGGYHSLALLNNGSVVGWGLNENGQATTPAGLSDVVAIAAGEFHSLALLDDGYERTVVGWGLNNNGQASSPVDWYGAVAIAAGGYHNLALQSDGTVTAWGLNDNGQASPPANLTKAVAIAAGSSHSLALKSDFTVVGWGDNTYGQTNTPVGLTGVVAIAAGAYHSLALKSDGTVVGWGDNLDWDGNWSGQATPPAGLSGVVAIAAGAYHSLALKSNGTVVGWGLDAEGEVSVPTGLSAGAAIAAGGYHNLAMSCAPSPPSALTAIAVSSRQINLSWTDNSSNEDRFGIERTTSSSGPWCEIASVSANGTEYSDTSVTCGQLYFYRVRAYSASGSSPYSDTTSANTWAVDSDCDGIPDTQMLKYFGHPTGLVSDNSLASGDSSGTGQNNLFKYIAGLNPTNPASVFVLKIVNVGGQVKQKNLIFNPVADGRIYTVQYCTDLVSGVWSPLAVQAGPLTNGNQVTITDLNATESKKFYRVKISLAASQSGMLAIDPNTAQFVSGGGTSNVAVTCTTSNYAWTATSGASWITITSANGGLGNGTMSYSVANNTCPAARSGVIAVAGQILIVTQDSGDSVGDGIPDWWRKQHFPPVDGSTTNNLSCAACDPDGDGLGNVQEYLAGTDPTNPAGAFRITGIRVVGSGILVTWNAVTNMTYAVQVATNSSSGNSGNVFHDLATVVVPPTPAITQTNYLDLGAATNRPARFYRVRLAP